MAACLLVCVVDTVGGCPWLYVCVYVCMCVNCLMDVHGCVCVGDRVRPVSVGACISLPHLGFSLRVFGSMRAE